MAQVLAAEWPTLLGLARGGSGSSGQQVRSRAGRDGGAVAGAGVEM